MEITCTRCHQPVVDGTTFCPTCGLPQLVYSADPANPEAQPGAQGPGALRDASMVDWKPAMRAVLLLAVPAGVLSSGLSPVGFFGIFWIMAAAAWAVAVYVRGQGPAWITMGAGARIGLVTGLIAAWLAFSVSGGTLFVQRYFLHHSAQIDQEWKSRVEMSQQMTQQWAAGLSPADSAQAQSLRTQVQGWMISPWGHAGIEAFSLGFDALILLFFAAGGGALGARIVARMRRPQV